MKNDLCERAILFTLRIVNLYQVMHEKQGAARVLSSQVLRSGSSIGSNLAESLGSQSEADYLTKLSIAVKEAHETQYWLEVVIRGGLLPEHRLASLKKECDELVAILTTICKRLKEKRKGNSRS